MTAAPELVRSLYREHGAVLLAYCARQLGGDRHTAEEVVQETLLRAWRHAETLDFGGQSPRPWLMTVASRLIVDLRRHRGARPQEVALTPVVTETTPAPDEIDTMLSKVVVLAALQTLTPAHRQTVAEIYLHGRTTTEVAAMLDLPLGTVRSRLFYALKALRLALVERGVIA
jgi:RNA polymerase sigma-70 factor (ECF subfamily)